MKRIKLTLGACAPLISSMAKARDVAFIFLAAFLLFAAPAQAQSIVTNGGFDTGDLSGWSMSGPGFVGAQPQDDGSFYGATTPPWAADFNGGNNPDPVALYQDLTTVTGTWYTLEFDFGVVGGPAPYDLPQSLVVMVISDPLGAATTVLTRTVTGTPNAPVVFTHYTYTFMATAPTTRVQFYNDGSNTLGEDSLLDTVAVSTLNLTPATPPGSNVLVQPTDTTTGNPAPVNLTFSTVTGGGTTSVTSSSTGAPPPAGFKLGNPPIYYDITTTATFSGSVEICINYSVVSYSKPSALKLYHLTNGTWVNTTTSNNTTTKVICGSTTSLSPFAVFESRYSAIVQPPINTNGTTVFNANRGTIPVKFTAELDGISTCDLPPATISLTRITGAAPGPINETSYIMASDNGSNFRISGCQYVYNLSLRSLGSGTYLVQLWIADAPVGAAAFGLQ